jgi:hypothetical protein
MTALGIPLERLHQSRDRPGVVMFPLPAELREFIDRFDHGLLPAHQGHVDVWQVLQLRALASDMPVPAKQRARDSVQVGKTPQLLASA